MKILPVGSVAKLPWESDVFSVAGSHELPKMFKCLFWGGPISFLVVYQLNKGLEDTPREEQDKEKRNS